MSGHVPIGNLAFLLPEIEENHHDNDAAEYRSEGGPCGFKTDLQNGEPGQNEREQKEGVAQDGDEVGGFFYHGDCLAIPWHYLRSSNLHFILRQYQAPHSIVVGAP